MKKLLAVLVPFIVLTLVFAPPALCRKNVIKIGINAPMTGDIPKVGEGSKFAGQMWLEDIKKAGGLKVGDKMPDFELPNVDGSRVVALSDLRSRGPVIVSFYRGGW